MDKDSYCRENGWHRNVSRDEGVNEHSSRHCHICQYETRTRAVLLLSDSAVGARKEESNLKEQRRDFAVEISCGLERLKEL